MSANTSMSVGFFDLNRAVAAQRVAIETAIRRVIDSGWFILGTEAEAFEREFAAAVGVEHAIGVGSGTDAIELSLRALAIEPGSEVITQANTCIPTVAAIARAGGKPVLCDADRASGTMDPELLAAAITNRTRAVVVVHLYGGCADMTAITALSKEAGIPLVGKDCAQALGARTPEGIAGSHGTLGAFSFYPTKLLGALGDAGAILTADGDLARRARRLRTYGQAEPGISVDEGVNSRLDELQAAILRSRLPGLGSALARRRAIAAHYDEALRDTPVTPLARFAGHEPAFQLYVVRTTRRVEFVEKLERGGVQTNVHYPVAVHEHPAYRSLADGPSSLTNAEALAREVVSLPLYPELTDAEVEHVATVARGAAGQA